MFYFIYLILFYIFLFLVGRGLLIALEKISNKKNFYDSKNVFNIKLFTFYPIIALFYIGNLTFIINFFTKINSELFTVHLFIFILLNLNKKLQIELNFYNLVLFFSLFFILSLSSYTTGFGYDAGLYHLNFQKILQSEKIIFGLANFHSRFGFSSIYDYIGVVFWLKNNLIALHYLNLTFIVFFYQSIYQVFFNTKNISFKIGSLSIILLGVLDNFGFNGGKNGYIEIEGITKYDTPFGILFFIGFYMATTIIFEKRNTKLEFFLIILISTFSLQMRPLGALLFILFLILLFQKNITKIKLINESLPFIVLTFFWIIKNLIMSGCFIYPVKFLCIEALPWHYSIIVKNETLDITNSLVAYNLGENIFQWFKIWENDNYYNASTILNFFITCILIIISSKTLTKFKNLFREKFFIFSFLLICSLVWLTNAPDFRFAIGIVLSISFFLPISKTAIYRKKVFNNLKVLFIILISLSAFALPRFDNYVSFFENPIEYPVLLAPEVKYQARLSGFGQEPLDTDERCWIAIECTPKYSIPVTKTKQYSYTFFHLLNK